MFHVAPAPAGGMRHGVAPPSASHTAQSLSMSAPTIDHQDSQEARRPHSSRSENCVLGARLRAGHDISPAAQRTSHCHTVRKKMKGLA